jgi:hypothetical protein
MNNPLRLTIDNINANVRQSAGVYLLDRTSAPTDQFKTDYVGRSDSNLNSRLQSWVGKYNWFMFEYASSPKAAFEAECKLYHAYNPRDNSIHPDRPANSGWKCPRCRNFD